MEAELRSFLAENFLLGEEFRELPGSASLIEAGIIRPVMDRAFPFEATNEALTYIETGRSKGKVVVRLR